MTDECVDVVSSLEFDCVGNIGLLANTFPSFILMSGFSTVNVRVCLDWVYSYNHAWRNLTRQGLVAVETVLCLPYVKIWGS